MKRIVCGGIIVYTGHVNFIRKHDLREFVTYHTLKRTGKEGREDMGFKKYRTILYILTVVMLAAWILPFGLTAEPAEAA